MHKLSKYFLLFSLLTLVACSGIENKNVDLESARNNPLLIPPCANQ